MQRDAELVADATRVLEVARRRAVGVVVVVPVAHEERVHVVTGVPEQDGGDGGIDAAGNARERRVGRHARIIGAPTGARPQSAAGSERGGVPSRDQVREQLERIADVPAR